MKRRSITLGDAESKAFSMLAAKRGVTAQAVMYGALLAYLRQQRKKDPTLP